MGLYRLPDSFFDINTIFLQPRAYGQLLGVIQRGHFLRLRKLLFISKHEFYIVYTLSNGIVTIGDATDNRLYGGSSVQGGSSGYRINKTDY